MRRFAYPESVRATYLTRIAIMLGGLRVPGGDVAAWLAPVHTAALAQILLWPSHRIAELLFVATGRARLAARGPTDPVQDFYAGDRTNVASGLSAECAVMVWATLRLARLDCAIGNVDAARDELRDLTRRLQAWAPALAPRFAPRIAELAAQVEALRTIPRADAVA